MPASMDLSHQSKSGAFFCMEREGPAFIEITRIEENSMKSEAWSLGPSSVFIVKSPRVDFFDDNIEEGVPAEAIFPLLRQILHVVCEAAGRLSSKDTLKRKNSMKKLRMKRFAKQSFIEHLSSRCDFDENRKRTTRCWEGGGSSQEPPR